MISAACPMVAVTSDRDDGRRHDVPDVDLRGVRADRDHLLDHVGRGDYAHDDVVLRDDEALLAPLGDDGGGLVTVMSGSTDSGFFLIMESTSASIPPFPEVWRIKRLEPVDLENAYY